MKILIACCSFSDPKVETVRSIYAMRFSDEHFAEVHFIKGCYGIALARNQAVYLALDNDFDAVFFVDYDVILPQDALTKLIACDADIAMGWYQLGDEGYVSASKYINNEEYPNGYYDKVPMPWILEQTGIIPVEAGGAGCLLVKTEVFKKLQSPYFVFVEYANRDVLSEDLYFFETIRRSGLNLNIVCDTSLRCGHIKQRII